MSFSLKLFTYLMVMAGVTYLIRMTPFVLLRKKIRSKRIRDVFFYLPYAFLAAMIIPDIFSSTGNLLTAIVGFCVSCILVFCNQSMIVVSLGASAAVFLADLFF